MTMAVNNIRHALDATDVIKNALTSGSNARAISVLSGVGGLALLPLSLVHPANSFTVGYGAAVASMSLAMILSFGIVVPRTPPELLLFASFVYGIRLAIFLTVRWLSVKSYGKAFKQMEGWSPLLGLSLVVPLSGLYACMVSPVLFLLRADNASLKTLQWTGVVLAFGGLALEAIADQHKFNTKRRHKIEFGEKRFVGPTGGVYSVCRHPNYLGEMMFWTGLFLGGMSSFYNSLIPLICGTLGWVGLMSIMLGSTKRLEEKQLKDYGGQKDFDEWRKRVDSPLIPLPPYI